VKKPEKYTQTLSDCQANESIFSLMAAALSKKKNAAVAPQRSEKLETTRFPVTSCTPTSCNWLRSLRGRMRLDWLGRRCKFLLRMVFEDLCVDRGVFIEDLRHGSILEDRTPRTLRLAAAQLMHSRDG